MRLNPLTIFGSLFVLILCAACSTTQTSTEFPQAPEFPQATEMRTAKEPVGDYLLLPGDKIEIKFFYHPNLQESIEIGPDGKISLQLIDDILAAGLTTSQLDEVLTQEYNRYLKNCNISVMVRDYSGNKVYVGGEVRNPRFVALKGNLSILQSVVEAGDFTKYAKPESVVLIRKGPGGKPLAMVVDLKPVIAGEHLENDAYLMASDIVYVPQTTVGKAGDFTDQVLRRVLFLQPFIGGVGTALGWKWVNDR